MNRRKFLSLVAPLMALPLLPLLPKLLRRENSGWRCMYHEDPVRAVGDGLEKFQSFDQFFAELPPWQKEAIEQMQLYGRVVVAMPPRHGKSAVPTIIDDPWHG